MSPEKYQEWLQFLSGKWILGMPDKPGKYFTCAISNPEDRSISMEVVVYADPSDQKLKFAKPWGGFIWSEPVPDLPFPGDENDS